MPGDPAQCREQAKRCLELASHASSPLAKSQFEALAQTWARLATNIDRTKALVAQWGSTEEMTKTG